MRNSRFIFGSFIFILLVGCTSVDSRKQFVEENIIYACEQTHCMDGQAVFFRVHCGCYMSLQTIVAGRRKQWNGHYHLSRISIIQKIMMSVL